MSAKSAGMYRLQLIALTLMLAAASAQGQSAWAYADVYYDAATDRVIATTTTLVDYSTEYYYSPKVQVSLSGSDGTYAWWYCPYGGAGACTNGNYAFGDVSVSATPGVTYTVQGYHSVAVYYHYYEADPGCVWGCDQWYDALGYSTGQCNSACEADPNCFCVEVWGAPYNHSYLPPWVVHLTYTAEQILGDTSKQATTQQASLSCTPSVVTRSSNVNCTVTGPGSTRVTDWSFTGGGGNVSGPPGVTWGGTMVQSGTISAKAAGLPTQPVNFNITVNARQWGNSPVSADKVGQGVIVTLPTPPAPMGSNSGLGWFAQDMGHTSFSVSTVPNGPNTGFLYHLNALQTSYLQTYFKYTINPDLENESFLFSTKQYGACNYIWHGSLWAQTIRHEAGSVTASHYTQYKNALTLHDPGLYFESRIGAPGTSEAAFGGETQSGLLIRYLAIGASTEIEPYPVNYSEWGVFLGNINYGPNYGSCP